MKTLPKNILFTGIETPLSYLYEEVIFLDKNIFVGKKQPTRAIIIQEMVLCEMIFLFWKPVLENSK